MSDGAGGAQGDQVADINQTAVAERGSSVGTDGILFQQTNIFVRFGQIVGTGQSEKVASVSTETRRCKGGQVDICLYREKI